MSAVIPEINGKYQVCMTPEPQVAIPIVANILFTNKITLSQNQKLRLDHNGVTEIASTYQSDTEYTDVVCTVPLAAQYGLDATWVGRTISIVVDPDPTTVPLSTVPSSDATLTDAVAVLAADQQDFIDYHYTGLPGTVNGPAMSDENYLTGPSAQTNNMQIPEDLTSTSTGEASLYSSTTA